MPKPTGMPALDVSEIAKQIQIEKPAVLSLLGKGALRSHVRRRLENEFDRLLFDFLNLYANRLRRWMKQSIHALRSAFSASADMQRDQFVPPKPDDVSDIASIKSDLRILRDWQILPAAQKNRA